MLSRTILLVMLGCLLLYGAVEATPLLSGPTLALSSPANWQTIPGGVATVAGVAKRVTALTLDGAPILPDDSGNFSSTLAFPQGISILTLVAKDRFGKSTSLTRTIYVPNQ